MTSGASGRHDAGMDDVAVTHASAEVVPQAHDGIRQRRARSRRELDLNRREHTTGVDEEIHLVPRRAM